MLYRYWVATTAKLWSDTSAWSTTSGGAGGATVPGVGYQATFDGAGGANGDCTLDTDVIVDAIVSTASYSGTIDLAGYNLGTSLSTGAIFAHTGDLDFGSGTTSIKDGQLTYSAVGGSILGTPIFHFAGTCT